VSWFFPTIIYYLCYNVTHCFPSWKDYNSGVLSTEVEVSPDFEDLYAYLFGNYAVLHGVTVD
jgi:hypothetical protein